MSVEKYQCSSCKHMFRRKVVRGVLNPLEGRAVPADPPCPRCGGQVVFFSEYLIRQDQAIVSAQCKMYDQARAVDARIEAALKKIGRSTFTRA